MVKFINLEAAINELEKIHNNVDPSDLFEKDLFDTTVEALQTLYAANHHKMISDSELRQEGLNFVNTYFEAYQNIGFVYKM
jgi:hypothetical protein